MKVIIQRTSSANVTVDNETIGTIDEGLVALVGITESDTEKDVEVIADKLVHLRIFEDNQGKMNHSLLDIGGSVLSISQFTLYADVKKGRRPSFIKAAQPDKANQLYEVFNEAVQSYGVDVKTGEFGAMMNINLINQGPVTIILETENGKWVENE